MLLKITDHQTIADVQDKFNECFPYLKIEFYKRPHAWQQGSSPADCYEADQRIGNIRKKHHPHILDIKSWYRTGDVEQLFREQLDLNVQIFRLDGDKWIQSTESDLLTLREQCDIAAATINKKTNQAEFEETLI